MSSDHQGASVGARAAIEARALSKVYPLYDQPRDRLFQLIWPKARKSRKEFVAVDQVDLKVAPGECVGVVGRNGSGKSTLLNMICGLLEPSSGELRVQGRVAPMLTIGAGFSPEFTGRENVQLNASLLGYTRSDLESRIQEIIEFADIGDFFDQPVKRYSSGMYSRLAFSAAIAIDPEILVMDEVLAVGDEAFSRKCFARIEQIRSKGSTIFFASHASNMILEICDRAILMDQGQCILQADPKTVVTQYQRLSFSPADKRPSIRSEIQEIGELPAEERASATSTLTVGVTESSKDFGRLDSSLLPESTVEYGDGRARISGVSIVDPVGRVVNLLRAGQTYRYRYEVEFSEEVLDVRFGMLVKLPSGFELGGQVSARAGEGLLRVHAGSRFRVEFSFRADLQPGTYFGNAGVLGAGEDEDTYLHRIVDALMFKILPGDSEGLTGVVDLSGETGCVVRPIA